MSKVSIAVFGISGTLGDALLEALQSSTFSEKIQYPVKAISRKERVSTDKVQFISTDLNETGKLAEQLKGADVFIELLGPSPDTFGNVEKIIAEVKPSIFIPSQFGMDLGAVQEWLPGILLIKTDHTENVRRLGVKVVEVVTGLFAIPGTFLYEWVGAAGIDPEKRTIEQRGDIHSRFAFSKVEDIAKSVVSAVTKEPLALPDKLFIQSGEITFKDVIERYETEHGVKLQTVSNESKEEAVSALKSLWKSEGFVYDRFFYYLQVVIAAGLDQGTRFSSNHDELVNPNESLWKWGKY